VSRTQSPATAVRTLIEYFRGFVANEQGIAESSGRALYEQLTLTRKGVCRHRAYAFVVTALALGIPARFVHNEAHAWVEVYDGQLWHRVDLGGAASGFHYDGEKPSGPAYRMPKDNYPWPTLARPGEALNPNHASDAADADATSPGSDGNGATGSSAGASTTGASAMAASATPNSTKGTASAAQTKPRASNLDGNADTGVQSNTPEYSESSNEERAAAHVNFKLLGKSTVHRGESVVIEGDVRGEGSPCKLTRVDIELRRQAERYSLGSAATDDRGHFQVQTTILQRLGVGPYELRVRSAESAACAASEK
jgi:hypothetical protein